MASGWSLFVFCLLVLCNASVRISIGKRAGTTARSFLAHGWEPWTATGAFKHFDEPAFSKAMSHLRGQTVRFGGISADWLAYIVNDTVTPECSFNHNKPFTPGVVACPFSTGALDRLLELFRASGIDMMFDLNELTGRNCTQENKATPWSPHEYCGNEPAEWDTTALSMLLRHVHKRGLEGIVGFELGNELFAPSHLPRETANEDIATLAALFKDVWGETPPRLFATGTNDCQRNNNNDTMETLLETNIDSGFSFHSYPGDMKGNWNKSDLTSYLLNTTWLRHDTGKAAALCLDAWNAGPRAAGLAVAVTEAAACTGCGDGTSSYIHGFFSVAQLGQFAQAGVSMLARWGIPQLLGVHGGGDAKWTVSDVASDFYLYVLYNATIGHGVLSVTGDEDSDVLVYAHCAAHERYGSNGSVTIMAANPSSSAVSLSISLPAIPRLEYVMTAPGGDLNTKTPVLNGDSKHPLALSADGSLPPMPGKFCGKGECADEITLPPLSQSFFVLLGASAGAACKS
jgi:hypothetical protein